MSDATIEHISPKAISWPDQERKHFGQEELAELADTIRVHGILEPIGVVRNGQGYVGLWGQRRWMAAELAGMQLVPAIVRDKPGTEAEAIEIRLIENTARKNLRNLEQASGIAQLMKAGNLTASAVAKRIGMKPAAVTKSLSLLSLPEPIRQKIDDGSISAAAGYELARVEDPRACLDLAAEVAAGSLNRDALAGRIKAIKRASPAANHSRHSRITAKLSANRRVTICASNLALDLVVSTLEELLSRCRSARNKGLTLATMLKVLVDESKSSS